MRSFYFSSILITLIFLAGNTFSQEIRFRKIVDHVSGNGPILIVAQDRNGYLWYNEIGKGIFRFDGIEEKNYLAQQDNVNSLANNDVITLMIDRGNRIWLGYFGAGFSIFDQEKNSFTHYRHNALDPSTILSDTVTAFLEDRSGSVWIGTYRGLEKFDPVTQKFTHFPYKANDSTGLSFYAISSIFEDSKGTIWVGCNSPVLDGDKFYQGGLNQLDQQTGKFKHYFHDSANVNSLASNMVSAISEDSKGNLWVGTAGDGLHSLDRNTGRIKRYSFDPAQPTMLSRGAINYGNYGDHITFIYEDDEATLWIGTFQGGVQRYDPRTKQMWHYGQTRDPHGNFYMDSSAGFTGRTPYRITKGIDNHLYIASTDRQIYRVELRNPSIPFISLNGIDGNTFYSDKMRKALWIGTSGGLIRKNATTTQVWKHDPKNSNSLASDTIGAMRGDKEGNLWLGTNNGLCKFEPEKNRFTTYRNFPKGSDQNIITTIFQDKVGLMWNSMTNSGVDVFDPQKNLFKKNFRHNAKDSTSLISDQVYAITQGTDDVYWVATRAGISRLDSLRGSFKNYNPRQSFRTIYCDADGVIWVGSIAGLWRYNKEKDRFDVFMDPVVRREMGYILHIMEDNKKQLWVSAANAVYRINSKRDSVYTYGENYGVKYTGFDYSDNLIAEDGQIFLGDVKGYYAFYPETLVVNKEKPLVSITDFIISGKNNNTEISSRINKLVRNNELVKLEYDQNNFTIEYNAFDFGLPGSERFSFMLENYDEEWRIIGKEKRAYYFNVPPGKYVFKVRAVNRYDQWVEKSVAITIIPPWWKTWWAITLGIIALGGLIRWFVDIRSKRLKTVNQQLEQKVRSRTEELNRSLEELKTTQTQLIQREKMASLGELTAGIAHEIQNPLNFVNNFSEVNQELIEDLKSEILAGKTDSAIQLANDLAGNEEKINHHGKRADAIVKGMLQHSRSSAGQKEPTDVNAMADEYLRLAYHGLRAKDKSFNVTLNTEYDPAVGKLNMVSQDIGRVLLNLYNNAFFAVQTKGNTYHHSGEDAVADEQKKEGNTVYNPVVNVRTERLNGMVKITVKDNGNGIPEKIKDKIFQPFFTTKPTGQGTGLGLSLSYDIVKAHGGEIVVNSKEGEGAEFQLVFHV